MNWPLVCGVSLKCFRSAPSNIPRFVLAISFNNLDIAYTRAVPILLMQSVKCFVYMLYLCKEDMDVSLTYSFLHTFIKGLTHSIKNVLFLRICRLDLGLLQYFSTTALMSVIKVYPKLSDNSQTETIDPRSYWTTDVGQLKIYAITCEVFKELVLNPP